MKQKRTSFCFVCGNKEILLVRYLITTHYKNTKYKHFNYDKKTITQTFMFACVHATCWRKRDLTLLEQEWQVKVWKNTQKTSPQNPIMIENKPYEQNIENQTIQEIPLESQEGEPRRSYRKIKASCPKT